MKQNEKQQNYELAERLLSEQNFIAAIIVGAVAAVLAAAIYSLVVARWGFSYGFASAGVGIAVGISMQYLGRGIDMKFAVAAAAFTIAGCVLGNVFIAVSPLDVFRSNDFLLVVEKAISNISLGDLVYWFVAVFAAVFLAKRPLSRADKLAIGMYELKGL